MLSIGKFLIAPILKNICVQLLWNSNLIFGLEKARKEIKRLITESSILGNGKGPEFSLIKMVFGKRSFFYLADL